MNFENGDLSHWHFYSGTAGAPASFVPTAPSPGRHTLASDTGLVGCSGCHTGPLDPITGIPIVAPGSGHYALRLGNMGTMGLAEKAIYYIHVPADAEKYGILYRYVAVLDEGLTASSPAAAEPWHSDEQQAVFRISIFDSASSLLLDSSCFYYNHVANAVLPGFLSLSPTTVRYLPWQNASIKLSAYAGRTIGIEFMTSGCTHMGHFAYAYIDFDTSYSIVSVSECDPSAPAVLSVPSGFALYPWYDSATFTVFYGTTNPITIPSALLPADLAVVLNPYPGFGCLDTLYARAGYPSDLAGPSSVCVAASIPLVPSISGGTWLSSDATIATVSSTGIVSGVSPGTVVITYNLPAGCMSFDTISVLPAPMAPAAITGIPTVCISTTTALSSTTPGGTWSTSDPAIVSVSGSGVVTGITSGTATISYAVANSCGSAASSLVITVNSAPAPPAAITGAGTICIGATTVLASTTSGGAWSTSDPAVAAVSGAGVVTGTSSGTATISYTLTNSCGSAAATTSITINTLPPTPAAVSGDDTVCVGATISLSSATSGGVWSTTIPAIATVSSTGVITGIASGTILVSYTLTNSCGSSAATKLIHVSPLPLTPSPITGMATLEVGGTTTLSNAVSGGSWSSDAPAVATVSSTGVVSGHSIGTAGISYAISNECGTEVVRQTVTVDPAPSVQVAGIDNDRRLTVYPNPTNREVTIKCKARAALPVQIEVADLIGRTLFSKSADWMGNEIKVDCSYLPDGIYLLSIRNAELLQTTKLTVRH